jgi:hypothetical protein
MKTPDFYNKSGFYDFTPVRINSDRGDLLFRGLVRQPLPSKTRCITQQGRMISRLNRLSDTSITFQHLSGRPVPL